MNERKMCDSISEKNVERIIQALFSINSSLDRICELLQANNTPVEIQLEIDGEKLEISPENLG